MSQLNLEEVVCLKSQQKLHREVVFSCVPQLAEFLIFYHRPRSSILHPAAISDHVPPQRAYAFPIFLSISPGYVYVAPTRDTYLNLLRLLHFLNLPHFDQNIPYTWFTCYICWRQNCHHCENIHLFSRQADTRGLELQGQQSFNKRSLLL